MSLPKSVKFTKNGIEYLSNCDRIQYTLKELERAALRDTGKYICKMTRKKSPPQNWQISEKYAILGTVKAGNS